jgi:hypothetical protein
MLVKALAMAPTCIIDCNVLGAWGQVASAFGTFVAVLVALTLARSERKVRGAGSVGLFSARLPGGNVQEIIQFSVTNHGERAFVVRFFGLRWKSRTTRAYVRKGIVFTLRHPTNTTLPAKLGPDEMAVHGDADVAGILRIWAESLAAIKLPVWVVLWFMRPCAFTPRAVIYLTCEHELKARLGAAIKAIRAGSPA